MTTLLDRDGLVAARVDRDQEDIRALYRLVGFTTAEEGLDLVEPDLGR